MKTILFIDESEGHHFLLQEELSEAGYEVLTANEIEEVLSKWGDFNPDLSIAWIQPLLRSRVRQTP
jgi:DNA-binding response OmpR family regulator